MKKKKGFKIVSVAFIAYLISLFEDQPKTNILRFSNFIIKKKLISFD